MEECLNEFNIWTDIVIPIIISPILLIGKIIYDKWNNRKKEALLMKNQLRLDKISNKLEKFYWPLYIRLLKDFDLWSRFTIFDNDFYDFIESDTESDIECEVNIIKCNYTYSKKIKNQLGIDENIIFKCNNPIHLNASSFYCLKHSKYSNIQNIEISSYNNEMGKTIEKIPVNLNNDEHLEDNISIKLDDDMYNSLTDNLLDNYNSINNIIIKNIHICEPNSQIGKQLMRFLKFTAVMNALIKTKHTVNPKKYNSPYPKKLLPIIEREVFKLQKEYNTLVDNFYYK